MKEVILQQSQREVVAVLTLYDRLLTTIAALSEAQKERLETETRINLLHLLFEGFDSSDRTKEGHYQLLKMLVDSGLYPDYKNRSLNTGSARTLTGYRAMLSLGLSMDESDAIAWDQLVELVKIHAAHSDNRLLASKNKKC